MKVSEEILPRKTTLKVIDVYFSFSGLNKQLHPCISRFGDVLLPLFPLRINDFKN